MKDTITLVHLVLSTLNDIEVRGQDNLDKLLGSINALETIAQTLQSSSTLESNMKEEANGG